MSYLFVHWIVLAATSGKNCSNTSEPTTSTAMTVALAPSPSPLQMIWIYSMKETGTCPVLQFIMHINYTVVHQSIRQTIHWHCYLIYLHNSKRNPFFLNRAAAACNVNKIDWFSNRCRCCFCWWCWCGCVFLYLLFRSFYSRFHQYGREHFHGFACAICWEYFFLILSIFFSTIFNRARLLVKQWQCWGRSCINDNSKC